MPKYTEQQNKDYEIVEKLRKEGADLTDPNTIKASGLTRERFSFVLTNLNGLRIGKGGRTTGKTKKRGNKDFYRRIQKKAVLSRKRNAAKKQKSAA